MKDSIELYIEHPTDWQQSEYVIVDFFINWVGDKLDDLGVEKWRTEDLAEWITEDIVYYELLNQIKKQNEQNQG